MRGSSRRLTLLPTQVRSSTAMLGYPSSSARHDWSAHDRGHFLSRGLYSADDVLIAGAAAQVARDSCPNLVLARFGVRLQELVGGHEKTRRTEAALQTVLFPERRLDRVQRAVGCGQP